MQRELKKWAATQACRADLEEIGRMAALHTLSKTIGQVLFPYEVEWDVADILFPTAVEDEDGNVIGYFPPVGEKWVTVTCWIRVPS